MLHVAEMYAKAEKSRSHALKDLLHYKDSNTSLTALKRQIDSYTDFLGSVAGLARTKWTEFNLVIMAIGFVVMLTSIFIHFVVIKRLDMLQKVSNPPGSNSMISFGMLFAYFVVAIRAVSVLSNSYICKSCFSLPFSDLAARIFLFRGLAARYSSCQT